MAGRTSILPRRGEARLGVCNLVGRRVVALVEGMQPDGLHLVRRDGRDHAVGRLASGAHGYRLTTEQQTRTRELLLPK